MKFTRPLLFLYSIILFVKACLAEDEWRRI